MRRMLVPADFGTPWRARKAEVSGIKKVAGAQELEPYLRVNQSGGNPLTSMSRATKLGTKAADVHFKVHLLKKLQIDTLQEQVP